MFGQNYFGKAYFGGNYFGRKIRQIERIVVRFLARFPFSRWKVSAPSAFFSVRTLDISVASRKPSASFLSRVCRADFQVKTGRATFNVRASE
jgi:hypothetical protein